MKQLNLSLFGALIASVFLSCSSAPAVVEQEETGNTDTKVFSFKRRNSEGILIGKKILLYDSATNIMLDISRLNGSMVSILAVSDSLFEDREIEDYCESFHYVRIRYKETEGWVDGRNINEIKPSQQDTSFTIESARFEIITTQFFGVPVSDDDGLTFCGGNHPVIFSDSRTGYRGFIRVKENHLSDSVKGWPQYEYFQLNDNDGFYDKITEAYLKDSNLVLKMYTEPQEGWMKTEVMIVREADGSYSAELIRFEDGD